MEILAWPAFENKTGNPYNRLLYRAVEQEGGDVREFTLQRALSSPGDLWHVHWPDDFLSYPSPLKAWTFVLAELVLMVFARLRGTRIVWTIHDLGPHESYHPRLERLFWQAFIPQVDGVVTLSKQALRRAQRRFPELQTVPSAVVPHGHYRPAYPDPVPRAEARRRRGLDPDAFVTAFVGRIRPYKNVESLVHAFRDWTASDAQLIVAGNPSSDALRQSIDDAAAPDVRVRTDLRFLPDAEMPDILGASDLVVLPYEDILHSGSALLALSFDRPVVVPDRGAMAELRSQVGAAWVFTYSGTLTSVVLEEARAWAESTPRPDRAPLDALHWSRLARQHLDLYERVLS